MLSQQQHSPHQYHPRSLSKITIPWPVSSKTVPKKNGRSEVQTLGRHQSSFDSFGIFTVDGFAQLPTCLLFWKRWSMITLSRKDEIVVQNRINQPAICFMDLYGWDSGKKNSSHLLLGCTSNDGRSLECQDLEYSAKIDLPPPIRCVLDSRKWLHGIFVGIPLQCWLIPLARRFPACDPIKELAIALATLTRQLLDKFQNHLSAPTYRFHRTKRTLTTRFGFCFELEQIKWRLQ